MKLRLLSSFLGLAFVLPSEAAIVISTNNEVGLGGVTNFFPTYVVSTTDLLNGLAPSASAGDFTLETAGGTPALTNGTYGSINSGVTGSHPSFGTAGNGGGSGQFVTYSLNLGPAVLGYDITSVVVYGGWNDSGRDQTRFTLAYSTVAAPGTFINITTADFNPVIAGGVQSATRVTVTENALPRLATGVAALRFTFNDAAVENGYVGFAELDAFGTATIPEPTVAVTLLGSLGLLGLRRRSRSA